MTSSLSPLVPAKPMSDELKERDAVKDASREAAIRLLIAQTASMLLFHRLRLGMTHEEVAKWAELSPATVRDAERGASNVTLKTIAAILFACGLEVVDLQTAPLGAADLRFGSGLSFAKAGK